MTNCTVSGNSAGSGGGGAHTGSRGRTTLAGGTTVSENSAGSYGADLGSSTSASISAPTITYSQSASVRRSSTTPPARRNFRVRGTIRDALEGFGGDSSR
jgi:hypothetical protein